MTSKVEPATMRRPALPHTARVNFPLTSVMPYGGAAYESTGSGTFLFLALQKKWERARAREKSTITCRFSVPVVVTSHALADITYDLAPFSKDQICFDPAALWPPFRFHCSPSLLCWRSRFCRLTWQRVDIYICEKSLEMCICLWPEFDWLSWDDPVWKDEYV